MIPTSLLWWCTVLCSNVLCEKIENGVTLPNLGCLYHILKTQTKWPNNTSYTCTEQLDRILIKYAQKCNPVKPTLWMERVFIRAWGRLGTQGAWTPRPPHGLVCVCVGGGGMVCMCFVVVVVLVFFYMSKDCKLFMCRPPIGLLFFETLLSAQNAWLHVDTQYTWVALGLAYILNL